MHNILNTSIQYLKGIGPKRAEFYNKIGINTIEDILYYFPRRYEDRTKLIPISELKEGDTQIIKAKILGRGERHSWRRRNFNIFKLIVGDESGKVFCVWFNQPYLKDYLKVGSTLIIYGKAERYGTRLQISSPEFEVISGEADEAISVGRIIPIYTLPKGITQRAFRRLVKNILEQYLPKLNDFLPYDIRSKNDLLNLAKSLLQIHFPDDIELQKQAYKRLCFEEFFLFQVMLALRRLKKKKKQGISHRIDKELVREFVSKLPFKLTNAQEDVIAEIISDMAGPEPMQRLLQGDVGSGKTVVSVIASLIAVQGGYQVAFMAPTEILAKQHFSVISNQPPPNGGVSLKMTGAAGSKEMKVLLLKSSLSKKEKEDVYRQIRDGQVDLVIGTHALLEEGVEFRKLGLVIIDEQHKFGVGQRALLPQKGYNPDVLIMTATPIPRTLAITLYGDMDISVINELPPGRIPVKTTHFELKNKQEAYSIAKEQAIMGHQIFIVYPVIEESFDLDITGAKKMYEELKSSEFRDFNCGLIHGRMKQEEQNGIMLKFKNKAIDVLISTTILEVGIDIPNATCIIIEHAERFGLAQLHQLRGRVGRGKVQSYCLLISDAQTEEARWRIESMVKYNDGFRIAEQDLKIRGPGEFFGSRQHGLSELKIGNPLAQMRLLKKARDEAIRVITRDAYLEQRQNRLLKEKLLQRFPEYEKLAIVG